jgi:fatty-acyl-CoA synthase
MMNFRTPTLDCALATVCEQYGEKTAIILNGRQVSYRDVYLHSRLIATNLYRLGIRRGDKVAILLSNSVEYLYLYFACFMIGAWAVPISTRWEEEEVANVLRDSDAKMAVYEKCIGSIEYGRILRSIRNRIPVCERFVCFGEQDGLSMNFDTLLESGPVFDASAAGCLPKPDDVALLAYTSGTTGKPKGVMIPHRSLVLTSVYTGELWDIQPGDIAFSVAPLYAAQGFLAVLIDLVSGVTMKWNANFNPNDILRELAGGGITFFHTQPTMWTILLSQPAFDFVDFKGLKKVIVSGSLCSAELAGRIEERVGCRVLNAYGLIEATGVVTVTRPDDDAETRLGTVGSPIPGVEYRIVDAERNDVANGETGELAVRGYVMKGYYKNEEKTAEVIDADGWLYTGDLACEYGRGKAVRIVGRCKDMIIRGGFNVYPIDIEECIMRNDAVDDASVVGKPDELLGESISAFVIPKAGFAMTPGEIKRFCRGKIANYKVPDDVHIVSQLPILLSGKVRKNVLREWAIHGIPPEYQILFDNKSLSEIAR